MRLPESKIKDAFLHPERDVRQFVLHYFSDSFSRDPEVMPLAIRAIEQYGHENAFQFSYGVSALAQTSQTIDWVIGELKRQQWQPNNNYAASLSRLLCNADPPLLIERQAEMLEAPGFDEFLAKVFVERLDLFTWDADQCWQELVTLCEQNKSKRYVTEFPYGYGTRLVEALARHDGLEKWIFSVFEEADQIEDFTDHPLGWLEPLVAKLAGETRLESATKVLVERLLNDGDLLNEECMRALVKIGTDSVVEELWAAYRDSQEAFVGHIAGTLGQVHSDLAVEKCMDLLVDEDDLDAQEFLGHSLLCQLSDEGFDLVYQMVTKEPELVFLQNDLVVTATLLDRRFPEYEMWKRDIQENGPKPERIVREFQERASSRLEVPLTSSTEKTSVSAALLNPPATSRSKEGKVGRNDPCPCGSGKKFKSAA